MNHIRMLLVVTVLMATSCGGDEPRAREHGEVLDEIAGVELFVNMQSGDGKPTIGRYVGRRPTPVGSVAKSGECGLWMPSVIRARGQYWLYVAENDCTGWHRIVLFTSADGVGFTRAAVVMETTDGELRVPEVVYDRGVFHLWFSRDVGGALAQEIVYAASPDGLNFVSHGVKLGRGDLGAISVSQALRVEGAWQLLVEGYSADLGRAQPYVVRFEDPAADEYDLVGRLDVESQPAPKLDPSFVCQTEDGWLGLFTSYGAGGDQLAHEWTSAYEAVSLDGPWQLVDAGPVLPLSNGDRMISVENPAAPRDSAAAVRCGTETAAGGAARVIASGRPKAQE